MKRKILILSALCLSVFCAFNYLRKTEAQTTPPPISGKFYKFETVAEFPVINTFPYRANVSINDFGTVALSGRIQSTPEPYEQIFVRGLNEPLRAITNPLGQNIFNRRFEGVQINNTNQVVSTTFRYSGSNDEQVNLWNGNAVESQTLIADHYLDFPTGILGAGLNNAGQTSFLAYHNFGAPSPRLVTGVRPNFNLGQVDAVSNFGPVIDDNGNVLFKAESSSGQTIRLSNYNLTTVTTIAEINTANFSSLGNNPGISDDGEVIVFQGVLNADGSTPNYNQTHQTTSGPGIFASIPIGGGNRKIIRIANRQVENLTPPQLTTGNNRDGVCDVPEQANCKNGELGFDDAGNGVFLNSFPDNPRVGVIHQPGGAPGIEGDTMVVSFLAAPNAASPGPPPQYFSDQFGLWTVQVDFKLESSVIREKPHKPIPVVQIGDTLGTRTISFIYPLEDSIARARTNTTGSPDDKPGEHRLAFRIDSSGTEIIVRATQKDTDQDGLYDHWETSGIDFDQNGTIDLALNNPIPGDPTGLGANPNRKDIFVEIDYMKGAGTGGHSHKPQPASLTAVKDAFAAAPVSNPNQSDGIILHSIVSEELPGVKINPLSRPQEAQQLTFYIRRPNYGDDFDDFKLGFPENPCSIAPTAGHFGTPQDRMSANCLNIIGARRLSFRYAIFGHDFTENRSGSAEINGNDLMVAFASFDVNRRAELIGSTTNCTRGEPAKDCGERIISQSTYMHELGHTLGLLHGGDQFYNCKPNYLSVMNYNFQFMQVDSRRPLDYSRSALPSLNENSLNETSGVGGSSQRTTAYGDDTGAGSAPNTLFYYTPMSGPVDWNHMNGPIDLTAQQNINYILNLECKNDDDQNGIADGKTTLTGVNDWQMLKYDFRSSVDFSDGLGNRQDSVGTEERSTVSIDTVANAADGDGDGVVDALDKCLDFPNTDQTDSDGDGYGNACDSISSDLGVTMTATPNRVRTGAQITYTITVTNNGPVEEANGIKINDDFPEALQINSITTTNGECDHFEASVFCQADSLTVGNSMTIIVSATPLTAASLSNTVKVENGIGDLNLANNTVTTINTAINASVPRFDYDGDGRSDIVVWRPSDGTWYILRSTDGAVIYQQFGQNGDKLAPADYDGDGLSDFTVFRPSTAAWWILKSSNGSISTFTFGLSGDKPIPGDYDGDGKADVGVFRPSTGMWYISRSLDGTTTTQSFGLANDKPVQSDYDGDGKTDLAVYRPGVTVSDWWILKSTDNSVLNVSFGDNTDKPVPGDYDGDGKTDFGVWRPSNGTWYTAPITDPNPALNFTSATFGQTSDKPQPADFDGDGKTDRAIWRPGTGYWWIQKSSDNSVYSLPWGLETDILVSSAYFFD